MIQKKSKALVYFLIVALDSISFCLIAPILAPLLAQHSVFFSQSTASYFLYGLLIALFPLAYMMASPLLGYLSDRFGRKPLLLTCLFLLLAAFVCYIVAFHLQQLSLLMIGRALAGAAAGSQIIAQAAMVDLADTTHKPRAIGFIAIAMTLGLVFGPLLASLWTATVSTYIFMAVIFLTIINLILLLLTEKDLPLTKIATEVSWLSLLKTPKVLHVLGVFFVFELGWSLYYQTLPLLLSFHWHYDNSRIGWICSYVGASLSLFLWIGTRIGLQFCNAKSLLQGAFLVGILAFLLSMSVDSISDLLVMVVPIVFAVALIYPLLIVELSDLSTVHQGFLIGFSGTVLAAAFACTGFLAGILSAYYCKLPLYLSAALWLIALIWYAYQSRIPITKLI